MKAIPKSELRSGGGTSLGELLAAVLAHQDLPKEVFNALSIALDDLQSGTQISHEAAYIQAVLDLTKAKGVFQDH